MAVYLRSKYRAAGSNLISDHADATAPPTGPPSPSSPDLAPRLSPARGGRTPPVRASLPLPGNKPCLVRRRRHCPVGAGRRRIRRRSGWRGAEGRESGEGLAGGGNVAALSGLVRGRGGGRTGEGKQSCLVSGWGRAGRCAGWGRQEVEDGRDGLGSKIFELKTAGGLELRRAR